MAFLLKTLEKTKRLFRTRKGYEGDGLENWLLPKQSHYNRFITWPARVQSPERFQEDEPSILVRTLDETVELFEKQYRMTKRESEIFALWVTRHGLRQIEESLFLSEATVKTHIRHIYSKCNVHSRHELVSMLEAFGEKQ